MGHSTGHHHHSHDVDWDAMAKYLELQGDVLLPYVTETVASAAELCRRDRIEVRRILDIGSGPGVATRELARHFASAQVVAADGSEALLQRAAARAAAAGLTGRVTTRQVELPDEIERLGRADLIWMAMVLHHIGDEGAMLRRLRRMLDPSGVLVLVEHGEPMRYLPDSADPVPPGLTDRLAAAHAAWLASLRAELPDATPSAGYPAMLEAAGFEPVIDRVAHVLLAPPLSIEGRQVVLEHLRQMRDMLGEGPEEQDRAALDVLIDEDHPLGVMRRPDAFLDASRHIYVARAA
jgi:ubiquinone/menaquinone biosynthesis C-methylase UbiE